MMDSYSQSQEQRPPPIAIDHLSLQQKLIVSPYGDSGSSGQKSLRTSQMFLEKYEDMQKSVGEGVQGSVRIYKKIKNQKLYAIKEIPIDKQTQSIHQKNYNQVVTLRGSPNLVRYCGFHSYLNEGKCFLVMNYYDFPSLDPKQKYPEQELKNIVYQILEGLKSMHKKNFIHRDIKPDNILYDRNSKKVIIIDLGVGRIVKKDNAGTQTGTPAYRAPQVDKAGYGNKIDIYALGLTIYELVTGIVPSKSFKMVAKNNTNFDPTRNQYAKFDEPQWQYFSKAFKQLVEKMMAYDAQYRYDVYQCLDHPGLIEKKISPGLFRQGSDSDRNIRSQASRPQKDKSQGISYQIPSKNQGSYYGNLGLQQIDSPSIPVSDQDL